MKLSTRGRYAVMALVDLARFQGDARVRLADIAARQGLSRPYLEQLFTQLRSAGLVKSMRGPKGGYRLTRPASAITVSEVILAVDEPIRVTRCSGQEGAPGCQLRGARCMTHNLWSELGHQIRLFLDGITLADVIEDRVLGRGQAPALVLEAAE